MIAWILPDFCPSAPKSMLQTRTVRNPRVEHHTAPAAVPLLQRAESRCIRQPARQLPASIYVLTGAFPNKCAEPTPTIHEHPNMKNPPVSFCPLASVKEGNAFASPARNNPPPQPIRPIMSCRSHMSYRSYKSYRSYNNELLVRDKGETIFCYGWWKSTVGGGKSVLG